MLCGTLLARYPLRVRLLTHNVYWFQGSPSRWGAERVAAVDEVFGGLADLYARAAADVIALQEVHDPALVARLAATLNLTACHHAPGGQRPDYGGALLARPRGAFTDHTTAPGHTHERCHHRVAVGDPPLHVANVHLPSNRRAASPAEGDGLRRAELDRVLATSPPPDVVMGDFNATPDSPPYRAMLEAGYIDTAAALDAPAPTWRSRIDYIWLHERHRPRLRGYACLDTGDFHRTGDDTPWRLSDHPPIMIELA